MMPGLLLRLIALLIFVAPAYAEPDTLIHTTPAKLRFSFENITLPGSEQMGLLGGTFLYDINDLASAGPAAYGALTGQRGGFITLGLAAELRREIRNNFEANAGLFVGAGGGRSALQGGGLMLRSHLGANFKSAWGNIGGGISYVDFPNSHSHSVQPYITYEHPFTTLIANGWPDRQQVESETDPDIAASESEFALVARSYRVPAGVVTDTGQPQHRSINLLGVEWQRYLSDNAFVKIEAEGAMGGQSNGYMQILLGGGYRLKVLDSTAVKLSASLGPAGGGSVATGGGLLVDASLAIQQHITNNLFVELGGGYVNAPDGDFRATSLNAKLGYSYSMPDMQGGSVPLGAIADYDQHNMRIRLVHQSYLENDPQWRNNNANLNVDLLGFQGDYFLTDRFYLSGQGIAAYQGKAGGYMAGLVGGGVHLPVLETPLFVDLELLGGAAGGGGLDVGGGMVWQGNAGLGYRFSGPYSLIASYGQIQAPGGNFKAHVIGVSLAYRFAFFAR